jgi:hypothetical protein
MRFFNTAGPVNSEKHYCLPPLQRFNLPDVLLLIEQEKYFVLHAPRQTGKTTCLLALMDYLNREGKYRSLYCNLEVGQSARENVREAMQAMLNEIGSMARDFLHDDFIGSIAQEVLDKAGPHGVLNETLTRWASHSEKPIVLLIDEIDSLVGDTLISVLRQVRAGHAKRPSHFPQCVILCGIRDVRDYRIHSAAEKTIITGGSAFNIKAESLRLGDFSRAEMEALYVQHTEETGQAFSREALDLAWTYTQGQPWLVNALGYETCFKIREGRDRTRTIGREMMEQAKENLILRRETHLDQLADKLKEERVRRVVEPILAGQKEPEKIPADDLDYVRDLGLVRMNGQIRIANAIYQEVIPRELIYTTQVTISQEPVWYIDPDGRLNMEKLMHAFQEFFREHSEHWIERFDYKEAGPQLLLQAFLQRIVNAGGSIEREYGLGRMRTDLLVIWSLAQRWETEKTTGRIHRENQRIVIELKILHKSLEKTLSEGLKQTFEYMDRCGTDEGHLVIFDRRLDRSWEEKVYHRKEKFSGKTIQVWGM